MAASWAHQVAAGMHGRHVVASYGVPTSQRILRPASDPAAGWLRYGSPRAGSYFRLVEEVVAYAHRGTATWPAPVYTADLNLEA